MKIDYPLPTRLDEIEAEIKNASDTLTKLYKERKELTEKKAANEEYEKLRALIVEDKNPICISIYPKKWGDNDKLLIGYIGNKYRPTLQGVVLEYSFDEDWGYTFYNVKNQDSFYVDQDQQYDLRNKEEELVEETIIYIKRINNTINKTTE